MPLGKNFLWCDCQQLIERGLEDKDTKEGESMKSYNHLWEQLVDKNNIISGIVNAASGNMKRDELKRMKANPEQYVNEIKNILEDYEIQPHTPKQINDGITAKIRTIVVPTVREHIVQHCVMNILKPIFMKGMYEHSYASTPGRGCHRGRKQIEKWLKKDPENMKYCLKLDIRKYFESIDQTVLLKKLATKIHDKKFLDLLTKIVHTADSGLPLGFYTSQWFANWLLQGLDHYIKEGLKAKFYIRYMDDMVIFDADKTRLHQIKDSIKEFLSQMGLKLKPNWQIFKLADKSRGRPLDFMGFKFFTYKITLRKSILRKARRKALAIKHKGHYTIYDARQMLTYLGWLKYSNTYRWYLRYIKPYVSFKDLRKYISRREKSVVQSRIKCAAA